MSKTNILELTTASVVSETEDYIPMVDVSDTTESGDGTTKKATVRKLLKDKALPSGDIVGTSDVQTLGGKTLTSPVITDIDITGGSATDIDITGGSISESTNVVEVLKKVYPVGCIYTSTVSTNPNTLFGFGTWSEYGQGRVLVGKSAEAEFDTIGKTGGAKTHTLTTAEMPIHKHSVYGFQTDPVVRPNNEGGGIALDDQGRWSMLPSSLQGVQNTGGGTAHNNLQPYIVVYFWKREN
jgi:hypothetical protein